MNLFKTLLLREWLQYRWGWTALLVVPVVLLLLLVPVSQVEGIDVMAPEPVAFISAGLTIGLVMALALGTSFYQLMSMPRRDQQDRSIEFWASLPGNDVQSLGAPLLAHAVLMPLVALVVATTGGALVGVTMTARELGMDGLRALQWQEAGLVLLWLLVRLAVGLVLALLWLSPFLLALMAASAWFKRWGAPLLLLGLGGFIKLYDSQVLMGILATQMTGARSAVVSGAPGLMSWDMKSEHGDSWGLQDFYDALYRFPQWVPHDVLLAVQELAKPQFVIGLLVAAGCFGLIVLQRRRSL